MSKFVWAKNLVNEFFLLWNSRKITSKKTFPLYVCKFYSQGNGTDKHWYEYQWNKSAFKVDLISFADKDSATLSLKLKLRYLYTNYIKVLYFGILMTFFDDMLYYMRLGISTVLVKYSFW